MEDPRGHKKRFDASKRRLRKVIGKKARRWAGMSSPLPVEPHLGNILGPVRGEPPPALPALPTSPAPPAPLAPPAPEDLEDFAVVLGLN